MDHALITAAGLWPRSNWLGPNLTRLPEAAARRCEVAVTIDGRLLTGRLGGAARYWTNPNTGEEIVRSYDLMYSVLPDEAEPCDITAQRDHAAATAKGLRSEVHRLM